MQNDFLQAFFKHHLQPNFLESDDSLDWTLRHGRTVALSYAIFDTPEKLNEVVGNDVLTKTVLKQAGADRVWTSNVCFIFLLQSVSIHLPCESKMSDV